MKRLSIGRKLYLYVLTVFLVFAVAFIVFQQKREKQYKISLLKTQLQSYNDAMNDVLQLTGRSDERSVAAYVAAHSKRGLRVTLISPDGRVVFDNVVKNYSALGNHSNRPEMKQALATGHGSTVDRNSATLRHDYFYSATYYPSSHYVIRSALPYDDNLSRSLQTDQHYIWFAVAAITLLTLLLYRFTSRLGQNIGKLRTFAYRANHGESLDTEELAQFPNDELGEIAERIIKMYKQLQTTRREQDVLKRQLTQNVAHELKTPVASIQGYLETILQNPAIDEATKATFLQRCYAQSQRLTSLLRDISTLNRLDDAPLRKNFEPVDINALVDALHGETLLQLQKREMTFSCRLPQGVSVEGDRDLLYGVFRNLTDNAIAYAGVGKAIEIDARREGDDWHFVFSDNGVGVASEHLPRLFERFYRIDKGRSRKMGGTGLGLAIVKNSVLLHGGHISVANNAGGGLRFDFTLPAAKAGK